MLLLRVDEIKSNHFTVKECKRYKSCINIFNSDKINSFYNKVWNTSFIS